MTTPTFTRLLGIETVLNDYYFLPNVGGGSSAMYYTNALQCCMVVYRLVLK